MSKLWALACLCGISEFDTLQCSVKTEDRVYCGVNIGLLAYALLQDYLAYRAGKEETRDNSSGNVIK